MLNTIKPRWVKALSFFFLIILACPHIAVADELGYRVVKSFPHSTSIFTQGLEYRDNFLYESAGKYGESLILKRRLNSTRIHKYRLMDKSVFGEGITLLADKLYQLSWKSQRGFIYNAATLELQKEFSYSGDGWGLTNNGQELIVSNGSSKILFLDLDSFKVKRTITVNLNGEPVDRLNELEWIEGYIYANIWTSSWIVIINPDSGNVVSYVNLANLLPSELTDKKTDVLNGIAYDRERKRLFVTGKYWPKLFQIELFKKTPSKPVVQL